MRTLVAATLLAGLLAMIGGCGGTMADNGKTAEPAPPTGQVELRAPTAEEIEAAKEAGKVRVVLETEKGSLTIELDGKAAPVAVANFINLAKAGFYNGMPFHRVEPGFVIQAGDPTNVGRAPVGYTIADEASPLKHTRGTAAMARLYRDGKMVPNSASTQFYLCLADTPHLDELGFTAFGRTVAGLDVIDRVRVGDTIRAARIVP